MINLDLSKRQNFYFNQALLKQLYFERAIQRHKGSVINYSNCILFLDKAQKKIAKYLDIDYKTSKEIEKDFHKKYNFAKIKDHIENLPISERIEYLMTVKKEYMHEDMLDVFDYSVDEYEFILQCNHELNYLKEVLDLKPEDKKDNSGPSLLHQDFSNSKMVLIFYYFFKSCGIEPRVSVDIAPIAKFIHLIAGKKLTSIESSDFYKKLRSAPNFKSDKELIKDLEFIKPLFQKVNLNDIVKMIDNEIKTARSEINQERTNKNKI